MPRRFQGAALACLSLLALSCHVPAASVLPPVAAAPPPSVIGEPRDDAFEAHVAEVVAYFESHRSGLTSHEIDGIARTIVEQALAHDLEPRLVMAVIHIESRANTYAVSPVGAMGLMQIMPQTGEELAHELALPWMGVSSLFDPELNVRMGVAYLRWLADRYGSTSTALAAYNWGPGRIDSKLRGGAPVPTQYVDSVLDAYERPPARRAKTAVNAEYTPPRA